jgi:hypothetical protein
MNLSTTFGSKDTSQERGKNGDKKDMSQSLNKFSKETAITDGLKLPDIDHIL